MHTLILVFAVLTYAQVLFAQVIKESEVREDDQVLQIKKSFNLEGEALSVTYASPEGGILSSAAPGKPFLPFRPSLKIKPSLADSLSKTTQDEMVRAIIVLKDQVYGVMREKSERMHMKEMEKLNQLSEICLYRGCKDKEQLKKQQRALRNRINYDAYQMATDAVKIQHKGLAAYVESLGGSVTHYYRIINSLSVIVPAMHIDTLAAIDEVSAIYEDSLLEPHLNISTKAVFANSWWYNGFLGGTLNAGIVDSGMDVLHPAFTGKEIISNTFHSTADTDPCYGDNPSSADDFSGHGTHVAGIVMSQGTSQCPECVGVTKGLNKTYNLKAAFRVSDACGGGASMYISDAMAAVEWAESQLDGPDVYNFSYGGPAYSSDDDDFARFWDAVVSANGKTLAISAGNSGPANTYFSTPAVAYNGLTVANMNDMNTSSRSDDKIGISSSRGPTASGRKKPDISAPGTNISSAYNEWESWYDFIDLSGTSMSAPHIAGSYLLLQEYLGTGMPASLSAKALLINSADSWTDNNTLSDTSDDSPVPGKHWDRTYGWGYLNLQKAYLDKDTVYFNALSATGKYLLYKGHMDAYEKATVTWNRRVLYNGGNYPGIWYIPSDIDVYLRKESDNTVLDTSSSSIDNVEEVSSSTNEDVVIKVKLINNIVDGASSEPFALAAESELLPGVMDTNLFINTQPFFCPNSTFAFSVSVANHGNIYSHNHYLTLDSEAGWALNTPNVQTGASVKPNGRNSVQWNMTAPASGTGSFSITGNSNSYGETFDIPKTTYTIGIRSPSFSDVPCDHPFYGWIEKLKEKGVTSGCGPNLYCGDNPILRKQMAVFLVRALGETPSTASYNAYFDDIADDVYAPFINRIRELGITAGCNARQYCPESSVARGQMAVFLTKAKGWTLYAPDTPTFADVPFSNPFSGYIERLWREGITSGCSTTLYCPDSGLTRGQMAVFISKAFLQ